MTSEPGTSPAWQNKIVFSVLLLALASYMGCRAFDDPANHAKGGSNQIVSDNSGGGIINNGNDSNSMSDPNSPDNGPTKTTNIKSFGNGFAMQYLPNPEYCLSIANPSPLVNSKVVINKCSNVAAQTFGLVNGSLTLGSGLAVFMSQNVANMPSKQMYLAAMGKSNATSVHIHSDTWQIFGCSATDCASMFVGATVAPGTSVTSKVFAASQIAKCAAAFAPVAIAGANPFAIYYTENSKMCLYANKTRAGFIACNATDTSQQWNFSSKGVLGALQNGDGLCLTLSADLKSISGATCDPKGINRIKVDGTNGLGLSGAAVAGWLSVDSRNQTITIGSDNKVASYMALGRLAK